MMHVWLRPLNGGWQEARCGTCGVWRTPSNETTHCDSTGIVTLAEVAASLRRIEELLTKLVQHECDRQ